MLSAKNMEQHGRKAANIQVLH